jgi:hypothetical protein
MRHPIATGSRRFPILRTLPRFAVRRSARGWFAACRWRQTGADFALAWTIRPAERT